MILNEKWLTHGMATPGAPSHSLMSSWIKEPKEKGNLLFATKRTICAVLTWGNRPLMGFRIFFKNPFLTTRAWQVHDCVSDPAMPPCIILITGRLCLCCCVTWTREHSPPEPPLKCFLECKIMHLTMPSQRLNDLYYLFITFKILKSVTAGNEVTRWTGWRSPLVMAYIKLKAGNV